MDADGRKGNKESHAWGHGNEYVSVAEPFQYVWRCRHCRTSTIIIHPHRQISPAMRQLKRKYHALVPLTGQAGEASYDDDDESATTSSTVASGFRSLVHITSIKQFRDLLVRWMVEQHIPLSAIEAEGFQTLLVLLSPAIKRYLVYSHNTVSSWIRDEHLDARAGIKALLARARSRIHIGFDLWTSSNALAICGVVAHFVGLDTTNQIVLLALRPRKGSHTGENIAEILLPVLQDYVIEETLGVFIADNAGSNDVAIELVLAQLHPDLASAAARRARCRGHIINLAARALLYCRDTGEFEETLAHSNSSDPTHSEAMESASRDKSPLAKYHQLAVYIRASPQRRARFQSFVHRVGKTS